MEVKELTLKDAFEGLKQTAVDFCAASADIKTRDSEWEYIIAVKRLKK